MAGSWVVATPECLEAAKTDVACWPAYACQLSAEVDPLLLDEHYQSDDRF